MNRSSLADRRNRLRVVAAEPKPQPKGGGALGLSRSYNFVEKNPVVDELRGLMGVEPYAKVAARTSLARGTVRNLFSGKTRNPMASTLELFARAYGKRVGLVDP